MAVVVLLIKSVLCAAVGASAIDWWNGCLTDDWSDREETI